MKKTLSFIIVLVLSLQLSVIYADYTLEVMEEQDLQLKRVGIISKADK